MMIDFDKIRKVQNQLGLDKDARLSNPSESTRINNIYTKEKALKPTQKVDPDRTGIEEFVPVIGDALDFTKIGEDINDKNYGQAALGLGLLLIPNAIEKPIKAGVKALKKNIAPIILNNVVDKVPTLRNQYFKMQDKNIIDGIYEVMKSHNGSPTLSNTLEGGYGFKELKLDPNIVKRARLSGSQFTSSPRITNSYFDNLNIVTVDNKHLIPSLFKEGKTSSMPNIREEIKNEIINFQKIPDAVGVNKYLGFDSYLVGLKRYNELGKLRTLKDIRGTAAHESAHIMENIYNFNFSKPTEEGYRPNLETTLGKLSHSILGSNIKGLEKWAKSPNELHADLWKFRTLNKIGARDLTDKEMDKFIKELGNKHFISNDVNKIKSVLKIMPALGGLYIMNNENNEKSNQ